MTVVRCKTGNGVCNLVRVALQREQEATFGFHITPRGFGPAVSEGNDWKARSDPFE